MIGHAHALTVRDDRERTRPVPRANGRRVWHGLFWLLWWAALGGGGYCEYLVQRHGGWYLSCYFAMSICALIMAFIVHRFYLSCCGKEEED